MEISICSFSFHRLLGAGKQDIFQYIRDCKVLGCTRLQPWNAHFALSAGLDAIVQLGRTPGKADAPDWLLPTQDKGYLKAVRQAAEDAQLPFELLAVDRAHIYEADPKLREENRRRAYQWLDIAESLSCPGARIDAGGPPEMPDDVFKIIIAGYNDLIARAKDKGVKIYFENHFGPTPHPENVIRLLENIGGLHYLFDSNNWAPGRQEDGWKMCARHANATHMKTFAFDAAGNEPSVDIPRCIKMLVQAGYKGVWGVESVPKDGEEIAAARKTIALIRKTLGELGVS
jgi:sugar phosphate isomerase/epimerase